MLSEQVAQPLTMHVSAKSDFNLDNLPKLNHLIAHSGVKHVSRF